MERGREGGVSKFPMSPLIRLSPSFPLTNPALPAEPHELGYHTLKICICVWSHLLWSNREELILCWRSAPNIPVWRHYSETNPAWMQHNYCCQGYGNTFTVDLPANDCSLLKCLFCLWEYRKNRGHNLPPPARPHIIRFRQFFAHQEPWWPEGTPFLCWMTLVSSKKLYLQRWCNVTGDGKHVRNTSNHSLHLWAGTLIRASCRYVSTVPAEINVLGWRTT